MSPTPLPEDFSSFFARDEFLCKCGKCKLGFESMQHSFLIDLYNARKRAGIPFVLTSAFRCATWNQAVGGVDSSAHTLGYAVDVAANTGARRYTIVTAALACGFTRIGIASNFVHLDSDPGKTGRVIWTY